MISINKIIENDNYIFYKIPSGKPNPTEKCTLETVENDSRKRVFQSKQKDGTCTYYALNTIRFRYGNNASEELQDQRKIEKVFSERRKSISTFEDKKSVLVKNVDEFKDMLIKLDFNRVTNKLENWEKYKKKFLFLLSDIELETLYVDFNNFLIQDTYSNMYDYFKSLNNINYRYSINKECLKKLGTSPKQLFEESMNEDYNNYSSYMIKTKLNGLDWKNFPFLFKNAFTECNVTALSAKLYDLKISSWDHTQPFQTFLETMKNEGPLVVSGIFGSYYYSEPPTTRETIKNISIYGWRPGTRIETSKTAHAITLIGARKYQNQELVFYIDPNDSSDPLKERKVYKISYASLINNVMGNKTCWLAKANSSPLPNGVAYAMKKFKVIDATS